MHWNSHLHLFSNVVSRKEWSIGPGNGKLRVITAITEPNVIQKILDHVLQQQAPPRQPPIRATGPITSEIQFDAS